MHEIKCMEYNAYNTMHRIQYIENNTYNTMHRMKFIESNAWSVMHRIDRSNIYRSYVAILRYNYMKCISPPPIIWEVAGTVSHDIDLRSPCFYNAFVSLQ